MPFQRARPSHEKAALELRKPKRLRPPPATRFMGQPAHAPTQTDMGELMKAVEGSRKWERERRGHGPSHKRSRGALAAPASLVLGFLSRLATASHDNATGHRLSSLLTCVES